MPSLTAAHDHSAIQRMIVRYVPEIRLGVSVENQISIGQRVIVDQVVQFRPLVHIGRDLILHGDGVDGKRRVVEEPQFHAGGVHVELAGFDGLHRVIRKRSIITRE